MDLHTRAPLFRRLAGAVVAVATLASCSTGSTGAEGGPVVLRVVMANDWAATTPVVDAAERFEDEHPGVEVRIEGAAFSDIPSTVLSRMSAGQDVAVAQWHAFAAGARGWAMPLTDVFDEHFDRDDFLPGAFDDVLWEGEVYGVPLDTNALVMITNDTLLEAAGVDPAGIRTLDDLAAASRQVHQHDRSKAGFLSSASSWSTYAFVRANGGELLDDRPGEELAFGFTDPAVVEVFQLLSDLAADGAVIPPNRPNFSKDAPAAFISQDTAILFSGTWDVQDLIDAADTLGFGYTVRRMPQGVPEGQGGTVLGGSSLYVPSGSEQRDLGMEFMSYLLDAGTGEELWRNEGRVPARRSLLASSELADEDVYRVVVDQLETAYPMRLIAYPEADLLYERELPSLLSGEAVPATLLGDIQEQLTTP
jgi:multiple sugar transport system substrate-binding protein